MEGAALSAPLRNVAATARRPPDYGGYRIASYKAYVESGCPEVAANALICLIHQTNDLLDQLLRQLDERFREGGGFTERLYRSRRG